MEEILFMKNIFVKFTMFYKKLLEFVLQLRTLYLHSHESHENLLVLPEGSLDSTFMFEKELDYDFLFYVFEKRPEVLKELMEFIEE